MMTNEQVSELIDKYNAGAATRAESAFLQYWFIDEATRYGEAFTENDRIEMERQIWSSLQKERPVAKHVSLWPRIAGMAAAIALMVFGIWFYNYRENEILKQVQDDVVYKNDVAPGKQGATLTLANGKTIRLSDAVKGELAKEAGVVISKTADGQLVYSISSSRTEGSDLSSSGKDRSSVPSVELTNTLSTAKGETYQLRLPDGSLVYLNAASSLEYPVNFTALKERRVKLTGEGYFEIAKDKAHPFIVKTDKQEVEVLGTHFNVNAYKDEGGDKTTLLEGSVKVSLLAVPAAEELAAARSGRPRNDVVLKPGQQANVADDITVNQVKIENVMAWKNGYFMFNDESLENIMLKVSRWYDVEVLYLDPEIRRVKFYGTVSKFEHVSKVLRKLELTGEVKFKIEGKQIKAFKIKKSLSN